MDVTQLVKQLRENGALEKVAAQGGLLGSDDRDVVKLAEDVAYAGRLYGHEIVIGMLEKIADVAAGASGKAEPSHGDKKNDPSNFKRIADKIMALKGMQTGGSAPGIPGKPETVVRETVATPGDKTKGPNQDDKVG